MDVSQGAFRAYQLGPQGDPFLARSSEPLRELGGPQDENTEKIREKFREFVAGTFYQTLLAAMRKTVGKNKLIHGGRAEEIFRNQLDQTLATRFAQSHGDAFSGKMFEQFMIRRMNPQGIGPGRVVGNGIRAPGETSQRPPHDLGQAGGSSET